MGVDPELVELARGDRRRWKWIVACTVIFLGSFVLVALVREAVRPCDSLGHPNDYPIESVTKIDCVPAFVIRGPESIYVLVGLSTHMPNEPIEWDEEGRLFVSSAHGETFRIDGRVQSGPAERPLARCPLKLISDELWLDIPEGIDDEMIARQCEQASAEDPDMGLRIPTDPGD